MKRILWALVGLLVSATTMGAPVGKSQAQVLAQQFMQSHGMLKQGERLTAVTTRRGISANEVPPYYVFNSGDDHGYVIVAGDDRADSILGYATSGTFDEEAMPDNMKAWLSGMEMEMRWLMNHANVNGRSAAPHAADKPAIPFLLTCQWDQGAPYNNLCPKDGGVNSAAGCVATAMASVMYYHKWPLSTTKPIPGYTTYSRKLSLAELPVVDFSWDTMKDAYRPSDDGYDVAQLMLYAGQAVKMDYTAEGSGASEYNVVEALKEYFDYDQNLYLAHREQYSIGQWDDLIYNELANNRPVFYVGTSMSVGHAFVCDGYDGNGFYHINWGWGGFCDNFFKLSVLNPSSTSGMGAGDTPDGFPNGQSAIIGFQKPTGDPVKPIVTPPLLTGLHSSKNRFEAEFENLTYRNIKYNVALATEDAEGQWDVFVQKTISFNYYSESTQKVSLPISQAITAPGNYKVVPLWRETGNDSIWYRAGQPYYYIDVKAEQQDDKLAFECVDHPVIDVKADNITPVGKMKVGWNEIKVTLVNNGDEYNGAIAIYCTDKPDFNSFPPGVTTLALPANSVTETSLFFNTTSLSNFAIRIYIDGDEPMEIGRKDFATYDLDLSDYEVTYDPLVLKVKIHNYSNYDYNRTLRALLYNGQKKQVGKLDKTQLIPAGEEVEFVYDTFNLKVPDHYYMRFQFQKSEIDPTFVTIDGQVDIDGENVGIEEVEADNARDARWFTPTGVRISTPEGRGLFIKNGKKVVR